MEYEQPDTNEEMKKKINRSKLLLKGSEIEWSI